MQRVLAVLSILSYAFAAVAVPLGSALYVQHNTAPTFLLPCPCGCQGDEQKCCCHHMTNTATFTSCGMGTQSILVPDASLNMALVETPRATVDGFGPSFLFSMTDERTLSGVAIRVEHPPRLSC